MSLQSLVLSTSFENFSIALVSDKKERPLTTFFCFSTFVCNTVWVGGWLAGWLNGGVSEWMGEYGRWMYGKQTLLSKSLLLHND